MKFLNKDGVSRLWANILATFLPKDSIVNSLDINDSSKVLSAAQGPIISTALSNLEDRLNNTSSPEEIPETDIIEICGASIEDGEEVEL